jgi:hypothetical protein
VRKSGGCSGIERAQGAEWALQEKVQQGRDVSGSVELGYGGGKGTDGGGKRTDSGVKSVDSGVKSVDSGGTKSASREHG